MEIREATPDDAESISRLIHSTALACCFSATEPCPDWFEASVAPGQIHRLLLDEKCYRVVARTAAALIGVLAIRERKFVKYCFVLPERQGSGIGRALWEFATHAEQTAQEMSVRSSTVAVAFYTRLGFQAVGEPRLFKGMSFQPMEARF